MKRHAFERIETMDEPLLLLFTYKHLPPPVDYDDGRCRFVKPDAVPTPPRYAV